MANIEIEKIDCYFEMISNIRFFGSVFIASYCYYYLIKQFMKKVERVWLVGMAYFMPMVILYYIPFMEYIQVEYSMQIVLYHISQPIC